MGNRLGADELWRRTPKLGKTLDIGTGKAKTSRHRTENKPIERDARGIENDGNQLDAPKPSAECEFM